MFPSSCILDIYFSNIFCLKIYSSDASQVVCFGHFELKIHFLKSVSWNETQSLCGGGLVLHQKSASGMRFYMVG